jgi:hypothetical protein
MSTQRGRWHRVTIEWGEDEITTTASVKTEGQGGGRPESSVAFCMECVLRQLNLSEVEVAAHLLSNADTKNANEETLAQAGGRFLRRREGAGA